jgi:hypothetical protein
MTQPRRLGRLIALSLPNGEEVAIDPTTVAAAREVDGKTVVERHFGLPALQSLDTVAEVLEQLQEAGWDGGGAT